jgi:uncharacterized membrane protein YedE/YeeE
MSTLIQFVLGLVFGIGLIIAGMADPAKVQNFLDFAAMPAGAWDPSLAFVLGGATIITFIGYRIVLKQPKPLFDTQFHLPHKTNIDAAILVGPAVFGIGWGLAGFCPGPAFVALGNGTSQAMIFVIAMLAGMVFARWLALARIAKQTKPA